MSISVSLLQLCFERIRCEMEFWTTDKQRSSSERNCSQKVYIWNTRGITSKCHMTIIFANIFRFERNTSWIILWTVHTVTTHIICRFRTDEFCRWPNSVLHGEYWNANVVSLHYVTIIRYRQSILFQSTRCWPPILFSEQSCVVACNDPLSRQHASLE